MIEHTDDVDAYVRLSNAYERMGNIYIGRRDAEGAEPYILKCYDIRKKLIGIYRSAERIQNLAYSCDKLGLIYRALGDTKKSKRYYLECKELSDGFKHCKLKCNEPVASFKMYCYYIPLFYSQL